MHVSFKTTITIGMRGNQPHDEEAQMIDAERRLFALASGFGGPQAGREAAQKTCQAVQQFLVKEAGDIDATLPFVLRSYFSLAGNILFNACLFSNRQLSLSNRKKSVHERGGASVVAGFMDGDLLALAGVGNCGAYLYRGGKEMRLVTPRSYAWLVDPEKAESGTSDSRFHIPLTAVGISDDFEPEIVEVKLQPGDWLFVQSEGISQAVRRQIAEAQMLGHEAPSESQLKGFESSENASGLLVVCA